MKILVLGANGMVGHVISRYFYEQGNEITTFTRTTCCIGRNIIGDAMDCEFFKSILLCDDFDVVINCIGLLVKDCENYPSKAIFLNSHLPHFAVDILKDKKAKFIQMSTDCVFSGKTGGYTEKSIPDGELFYDRVKALGEINDSKNLTFRNSIIGSDMNINGIGLFNWFMKQKGEISGFTKAIWTGVTTLTLAKAMEKAIEEDLSGLYNLVNNKNITKFELLQLFNKHFKNNALKINQNEQLNLDKSLICKRNDFSFDVPSYEKMIVEMKDWIYNHKDIYSHYFNSGE